MIRLLLILGKRNSHLNENNKNKINNRSKNPYVIKFKIITFLRDIICNKFHIRILKKRITQIPFQKAIINLSDLYDSRKY